MPLSTQDIADIAAWSASDMRAALAEWQAAQQAPGTARMVSRSTLYEARLLGMLASELPALLAATPIIDPAFQSVADDLATTWPDGDMANLTTDFCPAVSTWWIGDVISSLKTENLPAVVVSQTLPNGTDVTQGAIGYTDDNNATTYIFYVLPYKATTRRQMEAMRGAEIMGDFLRSRKEDLTTLWQNGRVMAVQRNLARMDSSGLPSLIVGMVGFSTFQRVTYARQ